LENKNNIELISLLEKLLDIEISQIDNELILEEKNFKLSVFMSELEEISEFSNLCYKDKYIYNKNYFEELLHVYGHSYYIREYFSEPFKIYDENKFIKYEISQPSLEYILLSYIKMLEMKTPFVPSLFSKKFCKGREVLNGTYSSYIVAKFKCLKTHKTLESYEKILSNYENLEVDKPLRNFIEFQFNEIKTLKIISNKKITNSEFHDLADSFRFWINYHTQIALIRRFDYIENSLESIKRINKIEEIESVPQKLYNKELLLYYELALSFDDPVFRFLSFYHILEYFFDKYAKGKRENEQIKIVMKKFLNEKLLKKNIFKLDFSSYNHKFTTNKFNSTENKLLNELDVNDELKFSYLDYYKYLTTEKVNFANADPLDANNFIHSLGNRIYAVRNAIVHRKEGKNRYKYKNYKKEDKEELKLELPIIRIVAEQFINQV